MCVRNSLYVSLWCKYVHATVCMLCVVYVYICVHATDCVLCEGVWCKYVHASVYVLGVDVCCKYVLLRSAVLILSFDTGQNSIFISLDRKLDNLKTNRIVVYAMYIALCTRTKIWMRCNFWLQFGTCVECEPTSNVPTFQTSIHEARVE